MADFRKIVVALAVLVFVAGMANAASFSCTATAQAPPQMRSEGQTELIGDLVLTCTGDGPVGLANFTVFTPSAVTSRVATDTTSGISEALLLVDEPGLLASATVPVAGPTPVLAPPNSATPGCTGIAPAACTYNVFQGFVSAVGVTPSVTFLGIPVVPPGTLTRTYRITNVRVNANAFAGGTTGSVPYTVQISISGTAAVPLNQTTFTAGFVTKSLLFEGPISARGVATTFNLFQQCVGINADFDTDNLPAAPEAGAAPSSEVTAFLRYRELIANAFKPRGTATQDQPGGSYNTESGLTPTGLTISPTPRANYGTRLRATFNNIPLGTEVWVTSRNWQLDTTVAANLFSAATGDAVLHDDTQTAGFADPGSDPWVQVVADDATSGTAIWEIFTASSTTQETFDFGLFLKAVPNPQTAPAVGIQGTVTGNYAPTSSSSSWDFAMARYIPRFKDAGTTYNLVIFNICRTNLLFPYVLGGVAGFDTGLAITNTSKDPWNTTPQSGTCKLNFYTSAAATTPAPFTTGSIGFKTTDIGPIWSNTAMGLAAGFNGYIIAQCDFQYAHGFAFVSDIGAHNIALGYLALILPDMDSIVAVEGLRPTVENLNN